MATTSLLTTKFQIPRVHSDLVLRPHLMEQLSQGLARQATLISAPAGFGKTTLLSQWLERSRHRVAWLSLDEGDDDPFRFWIYVINALQTLEAGLGADALVMLQARRAGPLPMESVLTSLINDLHAASANDKIVLVLDDYHFIKTPATQDTLGYFVKRQPQQFHLVISSRSDPLVPLARLRARNQLTEIRAVDLRFAAEEMARFFNEMMGLRLSAGQIASLERSSEGWIAGLQLAALSMRGRSDVSGFIDSFAGNNRYIIDYLIEEVLQQQPEAIQSFLLQTSLLERLTASLCDSLTLRSDGQVMLENLEKANLFISPLDDERRWYRYHHLFAEFLRHRLLLAHADTVPELQRRASEWHENHGLVADAINYALAAKDFDKAAGLIQSIARPTLLSGDVPRLLAWLDALPKESSRSRPELALAAAWALVVRGEPDRAEERLIGIEDKAIGADARYILGSVAAIRANTACLRQNAPLALEFSRQALELLPPECLAERGAVLREMGTVYAMEGDITEASRTLSDTVGLGQASDDSILGILGVGRLISVKIVQGQLRQAASGYDQVMRIAVGPGGSLLPYASVACIGMATVSYEWNDLEAAEGQAKAGVELGQQWARPAVVALGRVQLARLALARGDRDQTAGELRAADQLANVEDFAEVDPLVAACRLRLWTNSGQAETASGLIEQRGLRLDDDPDYLREPEYLALAWSTVMAATRGSDATALPQVASLLDRMAQRAEAGGRIGNLIEMIAIRSLALCAMGKPAEAITGLERALALAEPEGYIRTFVDLGAQMFNLLEYAASRGVARTYVSRLLTAFERDTASSQTDEVRTRVGRSTSVSPVSFAEPLSEREIEVLRLVAEGLSNQQIAERLIIAVGTVKRHINNIFGKLGAGSRIQAVSRARELGLL